MTSEEVLKLHYQAMMIIHDLNEEWNELDHSHGDGYYLLDAVKRLKKIAKVLKQFDDQP